MTRRSDMFINSLIGSPYQFFVTRTPINFGSVRNTLVVRPVSSLLRKSPVISRCVEYILVVKHHLPAILVGEYHCQLTLV